MCEGRGHTMQGAKEFFNICRCWLWETHEIIGLMWTFHTEKFFSYFIREEKFCSLQCSYFRSILTFLRNHTDLCAVANAQQYKDFIFSLRHKFKQVYPITQTLHKTNFLNLSHCYPCTLSQNICTEQMCTIQRQSKSWWFVLKGTQAWELFVLWFWNLYFFVVSYA